MKAVRVAFGFTLEVTSTVSVGVTIGAMVPSGIGISVGGIVGSLLVGAIVPSGIVGVDSGASVITIAPAYLPS